MRNYKTLPYEHQISGSELLVRNTVFANFDDMGTGKTKTFIDAACEISTTTSMQAVIVVCPNSLKNNWGGAQYGQIMTHGWESLDQSIYIIRSQNKLMSLDGIPETDIIWVIVNYESVWRTKNAVWLRAFMQRYNTVMVLDESQKIKNSTSSQSKGCINLGRYAKRRYIMTGTPVTKNPLDFWAQFRFLDEEITGHRYFNTFKMRYANLVTMSVERRNKQGRMVKRFFKKVAGFQNIPELLEKVGPWYRRVEKQDCLDLPEKVYVRREIEMNKEQVKAYKEMAAKLVCELEGKRITAPIALTKILRLLQITSGYVSNEGKVYYLGQSPKVAEIISVLEGHEGKAIIFYREKPERLMLEKALTAANISYGCIYGDVKEERRTEIQQAFQTTDQYEVILTQVGVGGIGLDLTAADLVLYISNSQSLEHRWQSEDRAMRIGQKKNVTYMDFLSVSPGPVMTMDHTVMLSLETKMDLAAMVVKNVDNLAAFFEGLANG